MFYCWTEAQAFDPDLVSCQLFLHRGGVAGNGARLKLSVAARKASCTPDGLREGRDGIRYLKPRGLRTVKSAELEPPFGSRAKTEMRIRSGRSLTLSGARAASSGLQRRPTPVSPTGGTW